MHAYRLLHSNSINCCSVLLCRLCTLSVSCLLNPQVQQDNNFTANFGKKTKQKNYTEVFFTTNSPSPRLVLHQQLSKSINIDRQS